MRISFGNILLSLAAWYAILTNSNMSSSGMCIEEYLKNRTMLMVDMLKNDAMSGLDEMRDVLAKKFSS